MPYDLLLPAFFLTLVANAVLVAAAIRGLVRNRADRARDSRALPSRSQRANVPVAPIAPAAPVAPIAPVAPTAERRRHATSARQRSATPPSRTAPPIVDDSVTTNPSLSPAADAPPPTTSVEPARRRRAPAKRADPTPTPDAGASGRSQSKKPRATGGRPSRRRFSLPPLDDDHDRVSRSIETFLSGGDTPDADVGSDPAAVPTTIAVVAIDGINAGLTSMDRRAVDAVDAAVATLDRTLRAAARTADRVARTGPGRYRIVLPATGELAARSYLRRVRATVDSSLEAADVPLALVTSTTMVLDEPEDAAAARADARLDATLASRARQAAIAKPRAAGDQG
jgi:GGDEF domain-containing protein